MENTVFDSFDACVDEMTCLERLKVEDSVSHIPHIQKKSNYDKTVI